MTDRDLMKQALEALTTAHLVVEDDMLADEIEQAFKALRERLAQPERPADFYDQAFALVQRQGKLIAELEEMLKGKTDD